MRYCLNSLAAVVIVSLFVLRVPLSAQTPAWERPGGALSGGYQIAFHPNGSIFTANLDGGVFRSTDSGVTWSSLNRVGAFPYGYASAIAIDTPSGTIYAGTGLARSSSPLVQSTDGGDHWSPTTFPYIPDISDIKIKGNGDIFVVMATDSVWRSTDHGATWKPLSMGPRPAYAMLWARRNRLAIDPAGVLYFVWEKGVMVSADNGDTWKRRKVIPPLWTDFILNAGLDGTVYLGARIAGRIQVITIYAGRNRGTTWRPIMRMPAGTTVPAMSDIVGMADNRIVFAGDLSRGALGTTDRGKHWAWMNTGMDQNNVGMQALALAPDGRLCGTTPTGFYRTTSILNAVAAALASGKERSADPPAAFALAQNYPNPFNPATSIEFTLPEDALVTLGVYNALGQEVAVLSDRAEFTQGENEVQFDASSFPSGVYYYRLSAEGIPDEEGNRSAPVFSDVKKMLLVR